LGPKPAKAKTNELSLSIQNKQYLESLPFNFGSNLVKIRVKANIKNSKVDSIIFRVKDGYVASSKRFCSIKLDNGFCDTLLLFMTKPLVVFPNDQNFVITAQVKFSYKNFIYSTQKVWIGKNIWADSIKYDDGVNLFTLSDLHRSSGNVKRNPIVDEFGLLSNSGLPNINELKEKVIEKESILELFKLLCDFQHNNKDVYEVGPLKNDKFLTIVPRYGGPNKKSFRLILKSPYSDLFQDFFDTIFKSELQE
jgi:hypothetical protein